MNIADNTDIAIHDLIRNRRSYRTFAPKPVDHDKLVRLLEAARWSPSARNDQPWRFIVVTREDAALFDDVAGSFAAFNLVWARSAAVFIVAARRQTWEADGLPNPYSDYDLGQAVAYLTVQAESEGLVSRQIGAFNHERVAEILEVPGNYKPLTIVALGYPGESSSLPEDYRQLEDAPRTRKPFGEIAHEGVWGKSLVP